MKMQTNNNIVFETSSNNNLTVSTNNFVCSAPIFIKPRPVLTITNMVEINYEEGTIKYLPGYKPDAAAKIFWDALGLEARNRLGK